MWEIGNPPPVQASWAFSIPKLARLKQLGEGRREGRKGQSCSVGAGDVHFSPDLLWTFYEPHLHQGHFPGPNVLYQEGGEAKQGDKGCSLWLLLRSIMYRLQFCGLKA